MSIGTEWTADKLQTNCSVNVINYTINPLVGSRSLRIEGTSASLSAPVGIGACYLLDPPYAKGHLLGRIRTLLRLETGHTDITKSGIYFNASQDIGISGSGSCYMFAINASRVLGLWKSISNGLSNASATQLSLSSTTVSIGAVKAIEIEWHGNLDEFGGVEMICKAGDAEDFSDLSEILHITDTSSPLLISNAEGLFMSFNGQNKDAAVEFDSTLVIATSIA